MAQYWHDHVHLLSRNPARSARFYKEVFGARLIEKMPIKADGRVIYNMELKGKSILIMKPAPGTRFARNVKGALPLEHFGIGTNDIKGAVAELKKKGVKITMNVTELVPRFFIAFVETPDGVSIELSQDNR